MLFRQIQLIKIWVDLIIEFTCMNWEWGVRVDRDTPWVNLLGQTRADWNDLVVWSHLNSSTSLLSCIGDNQFSSDRCSTTFKTTGLPTCLLTWYSMVGSVCLWQEGFPLLPRLTEHPPSLFCYQNKTLTDVEGGIPFYTIIYHVEMGTKSRVWVWRLSPLPRTQRRCCICLQY